MKNKALTPEQELLVSNLGAIVAGLQAPMSIGGPMMLGAAYEPTVNVRDQLKLVGYPKKEEITTKLRTALFG